MLRVVVLTSLMLCVTQMSCTMLCLPPGEGPLSEGRWSGESWSITAQVDGTAFVESSCAKGSILEPIEISGGQFDFTVSMAPEGVQPNPGNYEARFVGDICGNTMDGEVTVDGIMAPIELFLGEPSKLERCQTTSAPLPSVVWGD